MMPDLIRRFAQYRPVAEGGALCYPPLGLIDSSD